MQGPMRMKIYSIVGYFVLFCFVIFSQEPMPQSAIVCVPVADLVGSPLDDKLAPLGKTIIDRYLQLPYCGGNVQPGIACPRVHQLLFNEVVNVIASYEYQVCVTIPHLFYITAANSVPQNMYWTLKSNLVLLSELKKAKQNIHTLPTPFDFTNPEKISTQTPVLGLLYPWHDESLHMTFSAGTRFVYNPEQSTNEYYAAFRLHPKTHSIEQIRIPRTNAFVPSEMNQRQRIALFLDVLRNWIHSTNGFIPYVWGGCSYCTSLSDNIFQEIEISLKNTKTSLYNRPSIQKNIKSGFDCAGLIARAAQLCGIPYFYKNTLTLAHYLAPLAEHEMIQEGDLIWIPGHVMVIANIAKNTLIEARSYVSGYGIVHEIPLSDVFKDIQTFDQLIKAFHSKQVLTRFDKQKKEVEKISRLKILKLESVWQFLHRKNVKI